MTETAIAAHGPLIKETRAPLTVDDGGSAVSWPAVIGGAFVASAFSLMLVALGAGIGLISVSPWSANNPSVTTFGVLAGAWFIAVQLFASGLGGYLAGRLRTRWARVHTDEVYFSRHCARLAGLGGRGSGQRRIACLGRRLGSERSGAPRRLGDGSRRRGQRADSAPTGVAH
jgi:hypothetical protein